MLSSAVDGPQLLEVGWKAADSQWLVEQWRTRTTTVPSCSRGAMLAPGQADRSYTVLSRSALKFISGDRSPVLQGRRRPRRDVVRWCCHGGRTDRIDLDLEDAAKLPAACAPVSSLTGSPSRPYVSTSYVSRSYVSTLWNVYHSRVLPWDVALSLCIPECRPTSCNPRQMTCAWTVSRLP